MKRFFDSLVPPSSGTRFPALDGLRGVACLSVMFWHLGPIQKYLPFSDGRTAVAIFFVLSAFLLYYPSVCGKTMPALEYYKRRFWRIYPAYLLAIGCYLLVGLIDVQSIPSYLTFTHAWKPKLNNTWSLGPEVQFYVMLPIFVCLFSSWRKWLLIPVALCFWRLPWMISTLDIHNWPLLGAPFFFGMMAAHIVHRQYQKVALCAPLGIILLLTLSTWNKHHVSLLSDPLGLFASIGASLSIIGLASGKGICYRLFSSRPMRFLGISGYGIFLFCGPVAALLYAVTHHLLLAIYLTPFVTVIVGAISYLYVEAPMMRLGHSLRWPTKLPAAHKSPHSQATY